jgi:hypothetical protein
MWLTAGLGPCAARCPAPPRQRACLVRHHGVHALPQVLHAIVRFGRKKLERKERLCAGGPQRAAPQRRDAAAAHLALGDLGRMLFTERALGTARHAILVDAMQKFAMRTLLAHVLQPLATDFTTMLSILLIVLHFEIQGVFL